MSIKEQVLSEALRLQPLDETEDHGARAAWVAEAARRAAEIDSDAVASIHADEFWRRLCGDAIRREAR